MTEATNALAAWETFYVIVGSSGGALIGLQFVVMTLIADRRRGTHGGALGAQPSVRAIDEVIPA